MIIADKGTRVGNYLIDTTCFIILVIINLIVLGGLLHLIPENGSPYFGIYYFSLYFAYYFLFEFFLGKTPGKLLTKTRVVNRTGDKPTLRILIFRNLLRLLPIDNFTFLFGAGMHDSLSGTFVVYNNKLSDNSAT